MDSRERVFRAIRFECPDRVPVTYSCLPAAFLDHGPALIDLLKKYPNDFYSLDDIEIPEPKKEFYRPDGSYEHEYTDEWGCRWVEYREGITGQVIGHPLSDWSGLKDYQVPEHPLSSPDQVRENKARLDRMRKRYPAWGGGTNFFERMQWLRGFEPLLMDMAEGREEVCVLADRILEEYILPFVRASIEAGSEIIVIGDDWGTQQQLMISPPLWRKIFKPRYRRIFDTCHDGGALTYMHSDGMIVEIIPDLSEIGLDVINPQLSCTDLEELRKAADHRICISTDIDRQRLLPFGTPEQVREYIGNVFDVLGSPDGGLMWNGEIGPAVPLANAEAMLKAFNEFGKYRT